MIGIEKVDANELRKVLKVFKQFNSTIVKDLRNELKTPLVPIAQQIAASMPQQYPDLPSGMYHNGDTGYRAPKGKVSFTPGKSRSNATSLISMRIDAGKRRGFYIAELAGSRNKFSGKNRGYVRQSPSGPIQIAPFETNSGRSLVEQLNNRKPMKGKGGRFAYSQFRLQRPDIVRIATEIVNRTMRDFSRRLTDGN